MNEIINKLNELSNDDKLELLNDLMKFCEIKKREIFKDIEEND